MTRLTYLLTALLIAAVTASGAKPKKRTSADARSQRAKTEQQLKQTSKRLSLTEAELKSRLNRVNSLAAAISRSEANLAVLNRRLDSINVRTARITDSIAAGEQELARLRKLYTDAVRSSRRLRREMNTITFIFSAETFRQAWRRMSYLEQYSKWRRRKSDQITGLVAGLQAQRDQLAELKRRTSSLREQAAAEHRRLRADRDSVNSVITSLKGEQRQLNALLTKQKNTLRSLDDEIDRLIAQEAEEQRRREAEEAKRKAAEAAEAAKRAAQGVKTPDKKPEAKPSKPQTDFAPDRTTIENASGDFAARRGKLPSPLSHTYTIARPFGVQAHKVHTHVEVNNPGVDLETAPDATARAVHPGVVSAVFVQDGYQHVVLVRHGSYLTVYANVKGLKVKKGDRLKAGDIIGTVGPSEFNSSRGLLHFEIRREREKFDPMGWLKR